MSKTIKTILLVIFCTLGLIIGVILGKRHYINYQFSHLAYRPASIPFSVRKIEKYVLIGKTVVVHFVDLSQKSKETEIKLFSTNEITNFINDNSIIYMVIDVEKYNSQEVLDFMRDNDIYGVLPAFYITNLNNLSGNVYKGRVFTKSDFVSIISENNVSNSTDESQI